MKSSKQIAEEILLEADVKIDGKRLWDIKVKDDNFYSRVLSGGSLALGESYMDGWWECRAIDKFIEKILKAKLNKKIISKDFILNLIKAKILNLQKKSRAHIVGEKHYDIGNNLYRNMLDKRMIYSCGYFKNAKILEKAQEDKLELICRKIKLKKGMTVLDIGCGWGGFAKYAAEKYKAKVLGITISKEQAKLAKEITKDLNVEIKVMDYRNMKDKFDRIVSIGMFEHVGHKNYREFFRVADRCLKDDGLFLLHTIGKNKSTSQTDPWVNKYIFPNGILPSANQITKAYEGIFRLEDWHNFGMHYNKTLLAWYKNFNKNWDKIKDNYDEQFRRMWNYYLLSFAGSFKSHNSQLWQIVFSKIDSQIDYESVR